MTARSIKVPDGGPAGRIVVRAIIGALIVGTGLNVLNQSLSPLQSVMMFVTPFFTISIAQLLGIRAARRLHVPGSPAPSMGQTLRKHALFCNAVLIGVVMAASNASLMVIAGAMETGQLVLLNPLILAQAFMLPVLFGAVSQALAYRRTAQSLANTGIGAPHA